MDYSSADITVITPTVAGREAFLADCKNSVNWQTQPVAEHIIENANGRKAPVVRNAMVKKVKTDWILTLDDDDWLYPEYVENIVPHMHKADVIFTWPRWQGVKGQPHFLYKTFSPDTLEEFCPWQQTAVIRKSYWEKVGGQKTVHLEDRQLWIDLRDAGARFYTVEKALFVYRWHDGQARGGIRVPAKNS